jgi:molybdenum cofactor biosynthesis protein MoaC
MVDITHKNTTLRTAVAQAIVKVSAAETIDAIVNDKVPKGNVFEMAKTAGLFAVKKTADMIPDCHPLPVEYTHVSYEVDALEVRIFMEVKTIYRTGVEVEAMHGVSVVALTMYDMLKPIDKGIEIGTIKLVSKKGGKSDYRDTYKSAITAAVFVCSDTISAGEKEDKAGKLIQEKLEGYDVVTTTYKVIPDEVDQIQAAALGEVAKGTDLILFTGGTGLSPRDVTPEAIRPILDREIPGIAEAARNYGQERMSYAMLSRSLAGTKDESLIITLPGSTGGARETMDALFPAVLHSFRIFKGARHN